MSLIAQSQSEALSQLYDRYHRLVFSLSFAIVQDQATAEEITLDVFMRVWQKAKTYDPDRSKVSTWLTHITRHHAIDVIRRRSSRLDHRADLWDEANSFALSSDAGPAHSAEDSEQRERIQKALAQLPRDQKQALFLAYFQGYSQRQIAETLNQPLGTIKTRIRLALQKLRDFLQEPHTSVDEPSAYGISKEE